MTVATSPGARPISLDACVEMVTDLSDGTGGGPTGHEPVTHAQGREVLGRSPPIAAGVDHVSSVLRPAAERAAPSHWPISRRRDNRRPGRAGYRFRYRAERVSGPSYLAVA